MGRDCALYAGILGLGSPTPFKISFDTPSGPRLVNPSGVLTVVGRLQPPWLVVAERRRVVVEIPNDEPEGFVGRRMLPAYIST